MAVGTDDSGRVPARSWPRARRYASAVLQRAPWLVLAAGLIGEAAVLLVQDRRLWFFRDDWGYLLRRHISLHPASVLAPHNEHWSTLPIIAFRAMWHLFGIRHYLPYALMPLLLHLALAVCLVLLTRRAGAGVWPAVLTGLVVAYLGGGAGAEDPLWAANIGFIGSCLGGVVALLCFDLALAHRADGWGRRWFWIGETSLVASLMCSGMGVPMVITAAAWALLRRGPAAALRTVALPLALFVAWFAGWGHAGFANEPPLTEALVRGPLAAANGIGNIWSAATAMPGAGPAVLAVLAIAVVKVRHHPSLSALGAAGLVGLVVEYLIVGFGRSDVGLSQLLHSRYLYVGLLLCAPAVVCVFELIGRRMRELPRINVVAWLVAALLVVLLGSAETAQYAAVRRAADPAREQTLLAAAALIRSGAPLLSDRIDPYDLYRNPGMSVSSLKQAHALADVPSGQVGPIALFDERSVLQVNVQDRRMNVPPATDYRWTGAAVAAQPGRGGDVLRGCTAHRTTGTARLDTPLGPDGAQVEISFRPHGHTDRAVHTRVLQGGHASIVSTWPLDARWDLNRPQFFVASTMQDATLQVSFPAGQVDVCPAG